MSETTKHIKAASLLLELAMQNASKESIHRVIRPLRFAYSIVAEIRDYSTLKEEKR
jgi:hypothetical protein